MGVFSVFCQFLVDRRNREFPYLPRYNVPHHQSQKSLQLNQSLPLTLSRNSLDTKNRSKSQRELNVSPSPTEPTQPTESDVLQDHNKSTDPLSLQSSTQSINQELTKEVINPMIKIKMLS